MPRPAVTLSWLLAAGTLVAACAATPRRTPPSGAPTLAGGGAWTLVMADGACTLAGVADQASRGACRDLGEAHLAGPTAAALGAAVQALRLQSDETAGGMRGVLSTANAQYRIDVHDWGTVERQLRDHLAGVRVAEREQRFAAAPACPAGQVVLTLDACPGVPGPADVCGAPTHTCGAPLATGAACSHDTACRSGTCRVAGVCE